MKPPPPPPPPTHTHAHITATLIKYRSRVPVKNQYKNWEMYQIKYKESVTLHTHDRGLIKPRSPLRIFIKTKILRSLFKSEGYPIV